MRLHEHAQLIDALGGPTKIARYIKEKTGVAVSSQNVSMWRKQGVAQKYRPLLVTMARQARKTKHIPENFILGAAA